MADFEPRLIADRFLVLRVLNLTCSSRFWSLEAQSNIQQTRSATTVLHMNLFPYQAATSPSTPTPQRTRLGADDGALRPASNPRYPSSQAYPQTPGSSSSHNPWDYSTPQSTAQPASVGPPVTRSRTLYYLSVRDSSGSSRRTRKYKNRTGGYGGSGHGSGGLLGVGGEERAGLMGQEESEAGMESYRDAPGTSLPPKWSVEDA